MVASTRIQRSGCGAECVERNAMRNLSLTNQLLSAVISRLERNVAPWAALGEHVLVPRSFVEYRFGEGAEGNDLLPLGARPLDSGLDQPGARAGAAQFIANVGMVDNDAGVAGGRVCGFREALAVALDEESTPVAGDLVPDVHALWRLTSAFCRAACAA